jgi:hypothetical protein
VAGEHQHRVEQLAESKPNRAGVGIVAVNHIRNTADLAEVAQSVINELREMRPQRLLVQVSVGAAWESDDPSAVGDLFDVLGVLRIKIDAQDLAREKVNPFYVGVIGKGAGKVEYVSHLATGVSVAAELRVFASYEAMNADESDVETFGVFHFRELHSSRRR